MLNDVPFEAAFLRAAVLIGLVHEREIPDWAAALLDSRSSYTARLADAAAERVELSAIREALRPLAAAADLRGVAASVLTAAAIEHTLRARPGVEVVTMLGQIRQEFRHHLPEATAARIKTLENRLVFAQAGVPGQVIPSASDVAAILDEFAASGHFRVYFTDAVELCSFVAALSRTIVRDRIAAADESADCVAYAWLRRDAAGHADAVVLNQAAWLIAAREFAPLPIASRIPYPVTTDDGLPLIDGTTVASLGVEDVWSRFTGVTQGGSSDDRRR